MKLILPLFCLVAFCLAAPSTSESATVTLKDGSVVQGTVSTLKNGVYTITSQSLGQITIAQSDVQSIRYGKNTTGATSPGAAHAEEIQQIQRGLAGDSVTMSMISELQNDPQLKAILADPEIMRAVSTGDLTTLMANEKVMALMNNADIKAITGKVTGQ